MLFDPVGLTLKLRRHKTPPSDMPRRVAVLLYPGCIFFEVALALEVLAPAVAIDFYTPDGQPHQGSNGASISAANSFQALAKAKVSAVLVPGGDPGSILVPDRPASHPLQVQASNGALIAGICAGNLVIAAAGLLHGRRGTHNYTAEYARPEQVSTTEPYWEGMAYVRADIVQDGPIVTAQPWAYRKFAALVGHELAVLSASEAAALETYVQRRSIGLEA
jgi:putative intracellular protease/amidase